MCVRHQKRLLKGAAVRSGSSSSSSITRPRRVLGQTTSINSVPIASSSSLPINTLIDNAIKTYQQQSQQQQQQQQQQQEERQISRQRKSVRFAEDVKKEDGGSSNKTRTPKTSEVLIQTRILLKILEKEDPKLRLQLISAINDCRSMKNISKPAFARLVDGITRHMVQPEHWRLATEARLRIASK